MNPEKGVSRLQLWLIMLREPFSKMRLLACAVIVAGIIGMKLG
ncbi:hypothetical protein XNC1_0839 [Xenorhabdus nematophila ATCC 19061]|uniref:Uncharacterized protein n=1 Tax=Xenorhabdus nematophila (strain ATCC 19061 / DSM 3370 / CCUG 14189 / LMG 1036 / NCIMB 9965 / AN6) TaxID=406817 RepID=D3VKF8_XENNA|nr:hypothetical protein XNC1_0839 [Xenorhabdus nematophila ATCC 19061]